MFGLFMLILFIAVWFASNINANNEVRHRKKRAKEKGQDFYLDRNGTMVDIKTDIPYLIRKMDDGDIWKVNPYGDIPLENLSATNRANIDLSEKEKAIKEGKSIYPFEGYKDHKNDVIWGVRWKDMKTGEIYVKRNIMNTKILLNIRTGLLERIDDGYENRQFEFRDEFDEYGICTKKSTLYGQDALDRLNRDHIEQCKKNKDINFKWWNYYKTIL